jgi:hypothetical protein
MTTIRKQFIYELADDYLEQTNNLKKSAEWTYVGPDKIWIFVKTETNILNTSNYFTLEEDGPVVPTPIDCTKLEIDCSSDPLFCTLVGAGEPVDGATLPQYTEQLPNGEVYSRPLNPMPDHTYDINEATYDPEMKQWNYSWKETWVTWDDLKTIVARQLADLELELRKITDLPQSMRTKLEAYKLELENFETTWAGYAAYKVWPPIHPFA